LIEEKRLADERIAEQAETIQGVLDNMDPGVSLFDNEGKLAAFNERWLSLFDLPRGDIVTNGIPLSEIIDYLRSVGAFTGADEDASDKLRTLFESEKPFQVDHERPDGTVIDIRGGPMPGGGFIASYTDITDRKHMERELRRLATTDALTGANNRRRFTEISERELQRCKRYGHPLSVMILDADKFKNVNDTYGHEAGDRVLKTLAEVCKTQLRDVDVFGRFGGEEFTLTFPETTREMAIEAAERLRVALSESPVELDDGTTIDFTVSIGATVLMDEADTLGIMLQRADAALYQAKENGRNRVVFSNS
jgi:two-component system cell cycle response regulator